MAGRPDPCQINLKQGESQIPVKSVSKTDEV